MTECIIMIIFHCPKTQNQHRLFLHNKESLTDICVPPAVSIHFIIDIDAIL